MQVMSYAFHSVKNEHYKYGSRIQTDQLGRMRQQVNLPKESCCDGGILPSVTASKAATELKDAACNVLIESLITGAFLKSGPAVALPFCAPLRIAFKPRAL